MRRFNLNIFRKKSSLNFRKRRHRIQVDLVKHYSILFAEIIICILLGFFIVDAFGIRVQNVGSSMEETIKPNTYVLVNRLKYVFKDPKSMDIICYLPDNNSNNKYSIKRVIGVPGDKVRIANGCVYINDEKITDLTTVESIKDAGIAESDIILGKDEYFVLGDNRNNSEDSRYASVGNITKDEIYGEVYWKVTRSDFGWVY